MKLSQSVTYAVQAALRLADAQPTGPVSCGQLAAEGRMPERFLLQILREMTKQGILHSTRGGGGGFRLERPPREISLLDLIEAVDGPIAAGLPMKASLAAESGERLQQALEQIAEETRRQLQAIRLSDLAAPGGLAPAPPMLSACSFTPDGSPLYASLPAVAAG